MGVKIDLSIDPEPNEGSNVTRPVRLAVIGCGRIAQAAHFPALERADDVEVVAVSDPSLSVAQAVANRWDIPKAYDDQAELLADPDVEGVIVCAPDRFHHSIAAAALAAGKHVLVEKPLAASVEEAEDLVERVDETGLILQVGAMKRHDEGIAFAKEFIASELGEVRSFNAWYRIGDLRRGIEATLFQRTFADERATNVESGFKADRERYLLVTHGAHIFDTVRNLLGDVESVRALHRMDGRDNVWQVLVAMESGALGTISITVDVPGLPTEGIHVFGSTGHARINTPFPFYRMASYVEAYASGRTIVPTLTDGDAYERQAEAFTRAIRGEQAATPDVHDGKKAVELIAAVAQAATTGEKVTL